jgi:hypothetical protein
VWFVQSCEDHIKPDEPLFHRVLLSCHVFDGTVLLSMPLERSTWAPSKEGLTRTRSPFQIREACPFPVIPYRPYSMGQNLQEDGSETYRTHRTL